MVAQAAMASGRGREAASPRAIPSSGWTDIAKRTWYEFNEDRVLLTAAGATFYVLLALIPALASLVALYGLVFDPHGVTEQLRVISGLLPTEAQTLIEEQLRRLTSQPPGQLGAAFAGSLLLSLWSASAATKSLFEGMNVVYEEREERSFFHLSALAIAFTLAGLLGVIAVVTATIAMPLLLSQFTSYGTAILTQVATLAIVAAAIGGALLALYRWGPSRSAAQWRWLIPGTVLALILLAVSTAGFSWYARTFAAYNAYGSIGSVIGFMTWVWLSLAIILTGAEFNAEIEHQTLRDSTTGAPQPLGARGATMADTVGRASGSTTGKDEVPLLPLKDLRTDDATRAAAALGVAVVAVMVALRDR